MFLLCLGACFASKGSKDFGDFGLRVTRLVSCAEAGTSVWVADLGSGKKVEVSPPKDPQQTLDPTQKCTEVLDARRYFSRARTANLRESWKSPPRALGLRLGDDFLLWVIES